MKNKRGDLLNNVLGVIIAVIGLLIIFGGVYMLYQKYVNIDSENAKNTINVLEAKINAIENEQTGRVLIQGFDYTGDAWYIVGWGRDDIHKPGKCFDSCICICKLNNYDDFSDRNVTSLYDSVNVNGIKKCQDNGFCRTINVKSVKASRVARIPKNLLSWEIGIKELWESVPFQRYDDYIRVRKNVMEVIVTKNAEAVMVSHDDTDTLEYDKQSLKLELSGKFIDPND